VEMTNGSVIQDVNCVDVEIEKESLWVYFFNGAYFVDSEFDELWCQ
jgi:hypothetical protein